MKGEVFVGKYREKYRLSENITWENLEIWMDFFYEIGKFVENQDKINLYISYIEDIYPSIFLAKGVIDQYLENISYDLPSTSDVFQFEIGNTVLYKPDDEWLKAEVVDIINEPLYEGDSLNPRLKLKVILGKKNQYFPYVPKNRWADRIKLNSNFKSTAGSMVKINDNISSYFSEKYSEEVASYIQSTNLILVNIIGHNISEKFKSKLQLLEFSAFDYAYNLKEIFYFSDEEFSYRNINMIKSKQSKNNDKKFPVSIYVGDNASVTMLNSVTNRNIFVSNRRNKNSMREILLNNVNTSEKNEKQELLRKYLEKNEVDIPKGVEIYAY